LEKWLKAHQWQKERLKKKTDEKNKKARQKKKIDFTG